MNNERRKDIDRILGELQQLQSDIDYVLGEEQDAFDNMSEGLQQSYRGQATENAIGELESANSAVEEAISALENAKG